MGGTRRRLCPQAIVVPPRMSAYSEASKAVYRVFEGSSPVVGLSIDEAFLDVGAVDSISGTPHKMARALARRVLEVGLPITVGVAHTKFLAKVASGVAKPDGLLVVPPDRELAFLHPLPVERLWASARDGAEAARRRRGGVYVRGARLVSMLGRAAGRTCTRWPTAPVQARRRRGSDRNGRWAARRDRQGRSTRWRWRWWSG